MEESKSVVPFDDTEYMFKDIATPQNELEQIVPYIPEIEEAASDKSLPKMSSKTS